MRESKALPILRSLRESCRLLEDKQLSLALLRTAAEQCTASYGPSGGGRSAHLESLLEKNVLRLAALEEEIEALRLRVPEAAQEITALVASLEDPYEQHVLLGFYLHGKNITELGSELAFSRTHIRRLHDKAIAELDARLEEEEGGAA